MQRVLTFFQKLVTLALLSLICFISLDYVPFFISIPVLLLVFSILVRRITKEKPKELYNYTRSEKYFAKGGLRDLIKIPVTLVVLIHDVVVWVIWGIYQIIVLFADMVFFLKEVILLLIKAIIWFVMQLVPFWRLLFKLMVFYFLKWPWWIYRYAFRNLRKTYNWNIIRVSLAGSFFALFIIQLFHFFDFVFEIDGLIYIGVILSILPVSWIFGEIASIRGQKLMHSGYTEVKTNFRNGLESMRSLLFFLTLFIVLIILEIGLDLFGWLPKSGIILLGISLNINFFINIILIFLVIVIVFGSFVIPSYRLFNEFNETSVKNFFSLISYIGRRFLQICSGIIPSAFFALVALIPPLLVVLVSLTLTIGMKQNVINWKINTVEKKLQISGNQLEQVRFRKEIEYLKYIQQFPQNLMTEIYNRPLVENEINNITINLEKEIISLSRLKDDYEQKQGALTRQKADEQMKPVINQTRIDEITASLSLLNSTTKQQEENLLREIEEYRINVEFAERKYRQLPVYFYLSGLFFVFINTIVFAFLFGFYGNFFYSMYTFRNDGSKATWIDFIKEEHTKDDKQPLFSATLNALLILVVLGSLFYKNIMVFFLDIIL